MSRTQQVNLHYPGADDLDEEENEECEECAELTDTGPVCFDCWMQVNT